MAAPEGDGAKELPAEYQAEPELALAGGADGMDFIRRLLQDLPSRLAKEGVIADPEGFLLRAKILGSSDPILAGEFLLPAGASSAAILDTFQHGEVIRRFVTIPEGMPSILVHERLMAEEYLTGEIPVPVEGSVLPDTYDFERGEARSAVLARMQAAMQNYLAEAWPKRSPDIAVDNIRDAVILASIVEKETGKPSERRMVAGLYSNRVKDGMLLQPSTGGVHRSGHASKAGWSVVGGQPPSVALQPWLCRHSQPTTLSMAAQSTSLCWKLPSSMSLSMRVRL